jgi:hypothetical protein
MGHAPLLHGVLFGVAAATKAPLELLHGGRADEDVVGVEVGLLHQQHPLQVDVQQTHLRSSAATIHT